MIQSIYLKFVTLGGSYDVDVRLKKDFDKSTNFAKTNYKRIWVESFIERKLKANIVIVDIIPAGKRWQIYGLLYSIFQVFWN